MAHREPSRLPQALYTVTEATTVLRLSRAELYRQMTAGRLRFIHCGRARRITTKAIEDFISRLEEEAA